MPDIHPFRRVLILEDQVGPGQGLCTMTQHFFPEAEIIWGEKVLRHDGNGADIIQVTNPLEAYDFDDLVRQQKTIAWSYFAGELASVDGILGNINTRRYLPLLMSAGVHIITAGSDTLYNQDVLDNQLAHVKMDKPHDMSKFRTALLMLSLQGT